MVQVMEGGGVVIVSESLAQVRVVLQILTGIEQCLTPFETAVGKEVSHTRLPVRAKSLDEVTIGGNVLKCVKC